MVEVKDMTGFKSEHITVIERAGTKGRQAMWLCKCSCGKMFVVSGGSLRKGKTKSCGHIRYDLSERRKLAYRTIAKGTHGDSRSRLYATWCDIKQRCYNPHSISYPNYGGRGIKMCDEWSNFSAFRDWAMENGYDPKARRGQCTIDRIDTDKDYSPDNCRWVTMKEQSNNRRNSYTITYNGETHSASGWSEITGIPGNVIYSRYKAGWPVGKILSPLKYGQHKEIVGRY